MNDILPSSLQPITAALCTAIIIDKLNVTYDELEDMTLQQIMDGLNQHNDKSKEIAQERNSRNLKKIDGYGK